MSFSFDFSGDDIEDDEQLTSEVTNRTGALKLEGKNDVNATSSSSSSAVETAAMEEAKPRRENVKEFLNSLPSRISYTTSLIVSPQRERKALIPRRALFDVRMQIMAEAEDDDEEVDTSNLTTTTAKSKANATLEALGLGDADISQNVYEGGFKSWEGAMDLARLLLERGPRKDIDDLERCDGVIELGCGTALPSLILFQHALAAALPLPFTLADYNASVLRLVTLPNLLLVWALQHAPEAFDPAPPTLSPSDEITHPSGDLDITPSLLTKFTTSLAALGIPLTLLSGPWHPHHLPALIPLARQQSLLVLAAETIYSPGSLALFSATLLALLGKVERGKALVAAKRVYFGVGGSVDEFKRVVSTGGGVVFEVENSGVEGCDRAMRVKGGVGRALCEVQMC